MIDHRNRNYIHNLSSRVKVVYITAMISHVFILHCLAVESKLNVWVKSTVGS